VSIGGVSSSSPTRSFDDEVASRLLVQLTLRLKPTSLAGHRDDPWDASLQMALPLAYPDSHPHDMLYTEEEAKEAREDDVNLLEEAREQTLSRIAIYQQNL
jgi:hypothetical protein